jgi:hypothetical protein
MRAVSALRTAVWCPMFYGDRYRGRAFRKFLDLSRFISYFQLSFRYEMSNCFTFIVLLFGLIKAGDVPLSLSLLHFAPSMKRPSSALFHSMPSSCQMESYRSFISRVILNNRWRLAQMETFPVQHTVCFNLQYLHDFYLNRRLLQCASRTHENFNVVPQEKCVWDVLLSASVKVCGDYSVAHRVWTRCATRPVSSLSGAAGKTVGAGS